MKPAFPRIEFKRRYFLPFFALTALMLSLTFVWQSSYAQQSQLSLAYILIGLRSKKAPLDERNNLLTQAVLIRGITFVLTPEIEKELQTTGASKELVEAIRLKGLAAKVTSTPTPTPSATPAPTPKPSPSPDYTMYQQQADAHMVKGEYDLALADYNKVIELNPKNASTYLSRGLSYYYKESYSQAISDYNKGIELSPNESIAYFNRGDSYEKLGDPQKATADYQKAIELNPNNEPAKKALKKLQDEQAKAAQAKAEQPKTFMQSRSETVVPAPIEPKAEPQVVNLGPLTVEQAVKMIKPVYPPEAKKFKVEGAVTVLVNLDEEGNVLSAKVRSGPGMLRAVSEDAAKRSKFKPPLNNGEPVKATGIITYDFKVD